MVVEEFEKGIFMDIESGVVRIWDFIWKIVKFFEDKYGWDKLVGCSIWVFGFDEMGFNMFFDDILLI